VTESADPRHDLPTADPADAAVEDVLASLQSLQQRPVLEHAAVFEQAHDRLRALIDHAGDAPGETDAAPPPA
jgi:hypothetical protein